MLSCLFLSGQEISYDEVLRVTSRVNQEQRYVGTLDENALHTLPVGIVKEIASVKYTIAIDSAIFTPEAAFFHAYMAIEFPGTGKQLAFAARGVPFNPKGVLGGPDTRLMLVSDHEIPLGPRSTLLLRGDGSNFVEWDCNGFDAIQLAGEIELLKGLLIPHNENETVRANLNVRTSDLHNLIAQISIDPFTIRGMNDWVFSVQNALMDWSSRSNAPEMIFPPGYDAGTGEMWTGFYLRELEVSMPEAFEKNSGEPCSFLARNMLIDDEGISGILQANHILELEKGNMSGWNFSVDELGIQILKNAPQGGNLSGSLRLPLMDSLQAMRYEAMVSYHPQREELDYVFSCAPQNDVSFAVFSARADIFPTSSISVSKVNGKFKPEALINGRLAFSHENIQTGKLDVQHLQLSTEEPYIHNGIFSYVSGSTVSTANYPLSIDSIRIGLLQSAPMVEMKVMLNLMDVSEGGLAASTRIRICSKKDEGKLRFDKVDIGSVSLAMNTRAFTLNGELSFYSNDPVYGKGFMGNIALNIPDVLDPGFQASACFGKSQFRYFALDAFVPVNIPIGGSPIAIDRLMGGISYRMRGQYATIGQCSAQLYGQTNTGQMTQMYVPDQSKGLFFRAGASVKYMPNEKNFNGDAMLEIGFNASGGLDLIQLNGNAYFLSSVSERRSAPAPIQGNLLMRYEVPAKSFDAQLQVMMNIQNAISGSAQTRIHVDPSSWSVCVGRPSLPAQVSVRNFLSAEAYFLAGDDLEPMAPVPAPVASLVQNEHLNQSRDATALSQARGVAAGMRFGGGFYKSVGWDFFSVYGSFSYGAGFDMMLADYGRNAYCSGRLAPVGLNGKVAEGRMYAFLQGNIGAKGSIGERDFDVVILSGTVAALLQGKAPNPSWLYGAVMCQYEILSLIRGSVNFQFEIGEQCQIQQP